MYLLNNTLSVNSLSFKVEDKFLLEDLCLEFGNGVLHAILGPNGSGKSTLLKVLSGIWKPNKGTVSWNGLSLHTLERRKISQTISLVPQNPQPPFDFLVEEIVSMGRYAHNVHYWKTIDDPLIHYALNKLNVWHLRHRYINQISHGERQRVYIARALVSESPILLLDEPTANLDLKHQIEIWDLLQHLVEEGKVVIVTTHDLATTETHCQQVTVLHQGKCVGSGSFADLMTPKMLQDVFGVSTIKAPFSAIYRSKINAH